MTDLFNFIPAGPLRTIALFAVVGFLYTIAQKFMSQAGSSADRAVRNFR